MDSYSPLLPVRREVIEPYQEAFSDSYVGPDGQVYVDRTSRSVWRGGVCRPQAISVLSEVPSMIAEAIVVTLENIDIPQAVEQFKRRALISSQAALEGREKVYDPQTGTLVDSSEVLFRRTNAQCPRNSRKYRHGGRYDAVYGMRPTAKYQALKNGHTFSKIFGHFWEVLIEHKKYKST